MNNTTETKNTGITPEHDAALTAYAEYADSFYLSVQHSGVLASNAILRDLAARVVALEAKQPAPDNVSEFRRILVDKLTAELDATRDDLEEASRQLEAACKERNAARAEVERLKQELERAQRLLDEADEAHKRPSGDHAGARELYIEKSDLAARLEQAREEGREEARLGIAAKLKRWANAEHSDATNEDITLIRRLMSSHFNEATLRCAELARNWKPEASA